MSVLLGLFVMLSGAAALEARAESPADAWAACAWERMPVSSSNFIRVGAGEQVASRPSANPLATPEDVLRLRLDDACGDLLPRNILTSIFDSAKRMRIAALEASRPARAAARERNPRLLICEHSLEGRVLFTELGVKKESKPRGGSQVKCFVTASDGSLNDA